MIIGLTGKAGSGKDLVADIICRHRRAVKMAWADTLYEALAAITGMTVEQLQCRETKEVPIAWLGKSPRELLQTLGSEWGRMLVHRDMWVRIGMRRAREAVLQGYDVIFVGTRFDNEAHAVREEGGQIWRVERDDLSQHGTKTSHFSEAPLPDFLVDRTIFNNGTIDELERAVSGILK